MSEEAKVLEQTNEIVDIETAAPAETAVENTVEEIETPQAPAIDPSVDTEAVAKEIEEEITAHESSFSPANDILSKITEEHITEYLEGSREARQMEFKERREKRLLSAFKLLIIFGSAVAIVYFLKDNPAILVNILYIVAILTGLWFWKGKKEKDE